MKTQSTRFHHADKTFATTVSGRKRGLALLTRLLGAAALVLPVFVAQAAAVLTTLHSFQVSSAGANPWGALVQASDGYFYGTTSSGGSNNSGTVFKISPNGALTTLYSFTGGNDGAVPTGLVQGSDGYFYGTTSGSMAAGTVFRVSTNGALTTLHSFADGEDGVQSICRAGAGQRRQFLWHDFRGRLHRWRPQGYGTVFKISTNGALTSLYSFTGGH